MPEVINLLSSTPPRPTNRRDPPSSLRRFHSSPPGPVDPRSLSILSDDFTYDDELENPSKRRRRSHEPSSPGHTTAKLSKNPLLLFSDEIALSSDGAANTKTVSAWAGLDSDPIIFTSSAPNQQNKQSPLRPGNQGRSATTITIDDNSDGGIDFGTKTRGARRSWLEDIEEFSDPFSIPDPSYLCDISEDKMPSNGLSSRTANLLASLRAGSEGGKGMETTSSTKPRGRAKKGQEHTDEDENLDDIPEPRKAPRKTIPKRTTATTNPDKEAKARERAAAKEKRDQERQLEKERKQKLKEDKAKEKQLAADIAEANKLKVDKKDSTREMIIDLASTIKETSIGNQAVEYLRKLEVEHSFFRSAIPNIVKWRRKMTAKYNDILGYWEPCPLQIREEEHVLCLLPAQEFVDMVIAPVDPSTNTPSELELHVLRIKRAYPGCKIIYLIEGLTPWMRKNTNSRNRAYQAELRRQLDQPQGTEPNNSAPTSTSSRKKANKPETTPPVDDDTIEDALLQLQVTHVCLVHHSSAPAESAEWIKNFTEHISTVPYRRERMEQNDSAFCMDGGQVKPGEDKSDTFVKMLQEVNRVTASMAYGIINPYPNVRKLVQGMRNHGPGMLEDVKKSANKNGGLTDSRIGPAASKRLYKVFMGLDPGSTDI